VGPSRSPQNIYENVINELSKWFLLLICFFLSFSVLLLESIPFECDEEKRMQIKNLLQITYAHCCLFKEFLSGCKKNNAKLKIFFKNNVVKNYGKQ